MAQRVTRSQELAHFQITVDNKDYHHLSRFEIAGGKRISTSISARPIFEAQVLTVIAALRIRLSQR